ncbi:MAG: ABC transporter substrate-binding protein [Alphaproteobacteria bacterium]
MDSRAFLTVSAALALGLAALAQPAAAHEAPDEVRIGVLYPLSGAVAQAGADSLAAVETAVDIANNHYDLDFPLALTAGLPNLHGAKIRLIVADHQGKPEIGRAEAERLITQEKVVALYGAYHSSVTAAASNVAERLQIPYVTGESSSPKLHTRGFKWFFRTGPHDGHYTKVMFDFMRDLEKMKGIKIATAGIMHEDTQFGVDSARVQVELAEKAGIKVVNKLAYRSKTTSLISEVQSLKASNPDVYLPTSYTSDAMLFVRTAKELDYNPKLFIAQNAGYNDPTFRETMGKDAEGIISRGPFALDMADNIPLIKDLDRLYQKHSNGRAIFDPPVRTFTGALVLFDAINRAGSTDPEKIRVALTETNIPARQLTMPWQNIRFGPDGQNTGVGAILIQIQDGEFWSIYPFEVAAREVIYPFPRWADR